MAIASKLDAGLTLWLFILPLPLCLARLEMPGLVQLTSHRPFLQVSWGLLAIICALRTSEIPESSP